MIETMSKLVILKSYIVLVMLGYGIGEQIIHTIVAEVGAGNITYYSMKQEGSVTLILESLIGDADIYVSEKNDKPDYANYDLQSATCGNDVIVIPKEFTRPIGIGVFGHVYHDRSTYRLMVVLDYDGDEPDRVYSDLNRENKSDHWLFWFFVNILKLILEILA